MTAQTVGQLAALATAICWTVTSLSFEAAGKRVGSLQVNLIRLALALGMFSVYLAVRRGYVLPIDAGAHVWIWLSLSGLVGFVLGDLFLFQAFVDLGARRAMLIYSSVPPMTALIGWAILGERLAGLQLLAMGATVAGIVLVTTAKTAALPTTSASSPPSTAVPSASTVIRVPSAESHKVRGVWFAVLGSVGQALGLVLGRYGAPEYDAFAATQIRVLAGLIGFVLLFVVTRRWRRVAAAVRDRVAMRHMTRGAFFGPFVGVSLGLFAAQRAGTGIAATIIATVPVMLIPVTVFLFHDKVSVRETAGAVLAVAGVGLLFLV